jgi:hypothetical protein
MTGRGGRSAVGLGVVGLVSSGLLVPVFRLWEADLRVPLLLGGDTLFHGMLVKTTVEQGWYARNPHLGAPFGMELHDFPQSGDSLHIAIVRVLGWAFHDWALVMNLFFLATFVLAAITAYVVLRRLGIAPYAAVLPSVLFAYLPYHFYRGEAHLFYSGYYGVPFFCLLIIRQLTGEPWLVARSPEGRPRLSLRHRRAVMALVIAAVAASSNVYYATFTLLFLGIGGLVEYLVRRDWRTGASAAMLAVAIVGFLLVVYAPDISYTMRHGSNPEGRRRSVFETELYALKPAQLLLPAEGHRVESLARLKSRSLEVPNPSEGGQSLGLVGAVGYLGLIGYALRRILGADPVRNSLRESLALLAVIATLVGVAGGLSLVVALAGGTDIRSWNRVSIFIAFCSLTLVGLWLQAALPWLRRRNVLLPSLALAALLVLGIFDQTGNFYFAQEVSTHPKLAASWRSDADFVARMERMLSDGAAVFQLPYITFPEPGLVSPMQEYDLLRGYLHSRHLRWSYGGMRGRVADWPRALATSPTDYVVRAAAITGFQGLYLDRAGDTGGPFKTEDQLTAILGPPSVVSGDGRLVCFDLRPMAEDLRASHGAEAVGNARRHLLRPVRVRWGSGFYDQEGTPLNPFRWASQTAELELVNPLAERRNVSLVLELTGVQGTGDLRIEGAGRSDVHRLTSGRLEVRSVFTLDHGETVLRLTTTAPRIDAPGEPRQLHYRVNFLRVEDEPVTAALVPQG